MAELFRYIQHAFVVPSSTQPIDVDRQSDLQDSLRDATSRDLPSDRVRSIADAFVAKHFPSPEDDPFQMRSQLLSFSKLLAPPVEGADAIEQLITSTFDSDTSELAGSDPFLADKALLDDVLVCVKITTAFDRVDAHDLVAMRQAIAFIEDFVAGTITDTSVEGIRTSLRRPIRIPGEFLNPVPTSAVTPPSIPPSEPHDESSARQRDALLAEQRHLKRAYEAIMSLPPGQFELRPMSLNTDRPPERNAAAGRPPEKEVRGDGGQIGKIDTRSAAPSFLGIPAAAIEHLGSDVRKTLQKANIDIAAPASDVITAIKKQWQDVSRQLAPYQIPSPAKVFRVGVHLFAVKDTAPTTAPASREVR